MLLIKTVIVILVRNIKFQRRVVQIDNNTYISYQKTCFNTSSKIIGVHNFRIMIFLTAL